MIDKPVRQRRSGSEPGKTAHKTRKLEPENSPLLQAKIGEASDRARKPPARGSREAAERKTSVTEEVRQAGLSEVHARQEGNGTGPSARPFNRSRERKR